MQFIKSLVCLKGLDNSQRFISVATACLFSFILFNELFFTAIAVKMILVTLLIVCFFSSSIRRCRDAKHGARTAWISSLITMSSLTAIVFFDSGLSYLAMLLPVLSSVYLFSIPSHSPQVYVFGYSGPVDLSEFSKPVMVETKSLNSRIEPSLFGQVTHDDELTFSTANQGSYDQASAVESNKDKNQTPTLAVNKFAQAIHVWLGQNALVAKASFTGLVVLVCLILALPALINVNADAAGAEPGENSANAINQQMVTRNNLLEMPDQFYLLLDKNQGLIVHWQADVIRNGEVWSQVSATGDDTCQVIEFNNGDKVRTINVVVEASGDYYANFSPLDTASVVRSLARRGNFGLCGYNFSLKGSQKALNSNPIYADFSY